ncbi:MAG: outer membrane beta-barrel protein [Candidatus Cloacimonetes bacterium]|nr:porin family protein [Candidatus Cloacimonadota bacterium]MDD4156221.1 outer membrane beta-barrel protein [Candidatus Cloacimonadota bacterium]
MGKRNVLVVVLMLALTTVVWANQLSFGGNVAIALPMGDFGDVVDTGFGLNLRGNYHLENNPALVPTFSIGYLMWSGEESFGSVKWEYNYSCVPVKGGAKYFFADTGVYGMLELGLYFFSIEVEVPMSDWKSQKASMTVSDDETEFGFAPGIGYQHNLNEKLTLDAFLQYEKAGDVDYLSINLGVQF